MAKHMYLRGQIGFILICPYFSCIRINILLNFVRHRNKTYQCKTTPEKL